MAVLGSRARYQRAYVRPPMLRGLFTASSSAGGMCSGAGSRRNGSARPATSLSTTGNVVPSLARCFGEKRTPRRACRTRCSIVPPARRLLPLTPGTAFVRAVLRHERRLVPGGFCNVAGRRWRDGPLNTCPFTPLNDTQRTLFAIVARYC